MSRTTHARPPKRRGAEPRPPRAVPRKKTKAAVELAPLVPPDLKRCQAMKPNGVSAFSLGGVPARVRCADAPTVVITETRPGDDGRRGSMSLCDPCLQVARSQLGDAAFDFKMIPRRVVRHG